MPLLDVSLVTKSLITLIREHVKRSPAWPASTPLTVSPDPPDRLKGDDTLGFYLYHITEDAHHKNLPAPGRDAVPVRYTPMALNLYYILTAHSDLEDGTGSYHEQRMMGCAVKALRDHPVITAETEIGGVSVLGSLTTGGENRLRIVLQPVEPENAVTYWTAGSTALRLSAYYQVSVALLEAEEPGLRAGRVLDYGVDVFPNLGPRLMGSENTYTVALPGDPQPRTIEVRPAQVPIGGEVAFIGSGLSGDRMTLLLDTELWDDPVEMGADWGIAATPHRLQAVVQSTASGLAVVPGVYTAQAQVMHLREIAGGEVREMTQTSNAMPFLILPRIDSVGGPDGTGRFTIDGAIFQHPDLASDAVAVYVSDARLDGGTAGALNPGEFAVLDAATIAVRLPAGLTPGEALPVRVFVNGAESPPWWVEVPT